MKRERNKVILYTFLLSAILLCITFVAKLFPFTSLGADTTNMVIEANLQKYINYDLSDEDKGTLIQYEIKTKIEYGEEVLPVNEGQTIINLGQINGQYPYDVKVMTDNQTEYDASTGTLAIQSNQQDNADYVIIANYDTYTENNEERELRLKVSAKAVLANKENNEVSSEQQYNAFVTENVGDLTSIHCETQDIYNGYLKSNIINGTNYTTQYEQKEQIVVSKKEVQDTVEMLEDNTFIKQDMELGNNHNLVYKSTQIQKSDIERLLGQEGILEISDTDGNIIVTINQDTEFGEDGTLNITYENEPEAIILKTSHITNEGILNLKHTKEIKNTMTDIQGTSIKTVIQMNGRQNSYEIMNELKETETNVNVDISSTNWTNNQQNDVTFDIYLDASTVKNSMFRNPCIYIELPSQVEKVILGNSSILYGNGLELQEPYIATNENGSSIMVVNLTGAQTEYYENSLGLMTNIKIEATVILNKEIETTEDIVKVTYTNEYVLDGGTETGNKEIPVKLESYQEENIPEIEKEPEDLEEQNNDNNVETVIEESNPLTYSVGSSLAVNSNDLKMEVTPVKGDTTIQNGDILYEGEYIKYNVKVTNVSDKDINDVKIVAMIPDGVTYGELEADYYTEYGKYEYNFDSSIKNKEITIGKLKAKGSVSKFYEVKVDNLPENEQERKITTTIQSYVGEQVILDYQLMNAVKPAEVQVFLSAYTRTFQGEWNYNIDIIGTDEKEVTLQVKLPREFVIESYIIDGTGYEFTKDQISEDNVVTLTLPSGTYQIAGTIERSLLTEETEDSQVELSAVAKVITDGNVYISNENRIIYAYDSVSVQMTSANEGEEVKYGEEINYNITVTNTGKTNAEYFKNATVSVNVIDFLPTEVNPVSMTYETWKQENKETITKDISLRYEDENGRALEDIDLNVNIPYQESITIQVRTTAGLVNQKTTIQNSATVKGTEFTEGKINIKTKTSNTIKHIILPYNYNDNANGIDNPNNPNNPNDSNNSNGFNSTNDNENSERKYSISGTAWMDKNEDGKRTSEETLLDAITVMLVDIKDSSVVKSTTKTSNGGSYQFLNLEEGNYLVIFKYDLDKYTITEYQKSGVDSSFNSDAIQKTITLNGEQVTAGVTDTIELSSSVTNIDIGLIENKSCDFRINKSISKVTVSTASGTKQYAYDNTSLVKTEIKAKEINGATVSIEYKIVVTNEGEIAGTVNKIVDYLPNGLDFSSNINTNWAKSTNGELINTSIANQKIAIGESKELTLILTKQMTSESTGTFTNKAKIENATSIAGMTDNNSGNDTSSADIIISVSTGKAIIYISIILSVCVIIAIIIYLNRKYGFIRISKISMFFIVFMMMVCLQANILFSTAVELDNETVVTSTMIGDSYSWRYLHYQYCTPKNHTTGPHNAHRFDSNSEIFAGVIGHCGNHNKGIKGGEYTSNKYVSYQITDWNGETNYGDWGTPEAINLTSQPSNIEMRKKEVGGQIYYVYGPFVANCETLDVKYHKKVFDSSGNSITDNFQFSSEDGQQTGGAYRPDGKIGRFQFYLRCAENVAKTFEIRQVELHAEKSVQVSRTREKKGNVIFENNQTTHQPIVTREAEENQFIVEQAIEYDSRIVKEKCSWDVGVGCLEINKIDADNANVSLSDVEIRIYNRNSGQEYGGVTDSNGKIFFENIPYGIYVIKEIDNPHYGYDAQATAEVETSVNRGKLEYYSLKNEKQTGNLRIKKVDQDSGTALAGVSFKIKSKVTDHEGYIRVKDANGTVQPQVTGNIVVGDLEYDSNEKHATEFITDSSGIVGIYNLLIGDYEVIETSVGNNTNYDIDDDYITWETNAGSGRGNIATIKVVRQSSGNTNTVNENVDFITVKNRRKYISLSGYVWEDIPEVGKDEDKRNGLYGDPQDKRLEGITVQLKNSKGNIVKLKNIEGEMEEAIMTTTGGTDEQERGKYKFERVLIDDLPSMYVEFLYNGMCYQSVEPQINPPNEIKEAELLTNTQNGSKATEKGIQEDNRKEFNSKYETITYGRSNEYDLKYENSDNVSTLLYRNDGDKSKYIYGYEGNTGGPVSGVDDQYIIGADTYKAYKDHYIGEEEGIDTPDNIRKNDVSEIKYINLGIESREQPDLSLVKDLSKVQVSINGQNHVYKYEDRYKSQLWTEDPYNMSPRVKFGEGYGTMSYTRALYPSDVYATDKITNNNPLQVKVTYKIGVYNHNVNLTTIVNEITDYYDARYFGPDVDVDKSFVHVGTEIEDNGNIKSGTELTFDFENVQNKSYYKMKIYGKDKNGEDKIKANQKESPVYVQLEVPLENVKSILEQEESELFNAAEITSYSTKKYNEITKKDDVYAAVDINSQPGNLNMDDVLQKPKGNYDTCEDDNDIAPGLKLILQEERKTDGTVFVDRTEDNLSTGEIRQGDGEYKSEEDKVVVPEVEVKLVKTDSTGKIKQTDNGEMEVAKVYNPNNPEERRWEPATTKTDGNGYFTITGFIPDTYQIVYIWGNETYKVQDYKGTIYKEPDREEDLEWYKLDNRYSDAKDNYEIRRAIDDQSKIVTYRNQTIIEDYQENTTLKLGDGTEDTLITKMTSNTPTFRVNIEYSEDSTNVSDKYVLDENRKDSN